jgi:hypothetical protein
MAVTAPPDAVYAITAPDPSDEKLYVPPVIPDKGTVAMD